ncbi:unnamed protein product [Prunus armeniaca]|uniref:DUF2828 domain-containing protein n=1 Tax=Prunus armeniaca TaxID=36596 RepID=A0A6J5XKE5_PRUAR|nr:unnamed protein product [Prunus armeniaca]CAB4311484.1 unnamed protein product [Prunus armeniaca]
MNIATVLQVGLPSTRVMAPPAALTIPTSTPLAFRPPLLLTRRRSMAMAIAFAKPDKINGFTSYSDPCLDLFFNVKKPQKEVEDDDDEQKQASLDSHYSLNLLPQLLEVAWSHDPLTTLKLIFNLNSCVRENGTPTPSTRRRFASTRTTPRR